MCVCVGACVHVWMRACVCVCVCVSLSHVIAKTERRNSGRSGLSENQENVSHMFSLKLDFQLKLFKRNLGVINMGFKREISAGNTNLRYNFMAQ